MGPFSRWPPAPTPYRLGVHKPSEGDTMKKVIVVSDLHADRWGPERFAAFRDFLYYVRSSASRLVVNGDLLDLPPVEGEELSDQVKAVLGELVALPLSGVELVYLPGNHDIALRGLPLTLPNFQLAYPRLLFNVGRKRVYVEHGHYYDPLFNGGYDMLEALRKFTGYDVGKVAVDTWKAITRLLQRVAPSEPENEVGQTEVPDRLRKVWEQAARNVRKEFRCDYVLFGHTHSPKPPDEKPRYYINTGDWETHMTVTEFDEDGVPLQYDWAANPRVALR